MRNTAGGPVYIASDRTLKNTASVWGSQVGYDTITVVIKEFWPDIRRKFKKATALNPVRPRLRIPIQPLPRQSVFAAAHLRRRSAWPTHAATGALHSRTIANSMAAAKKANTRTRERI